ncbi:SAM-dependent methyltransferase, partial [Streptomyces drozdowiczii]|nr:SAM-dependent methyltransferase [Streptomyces drozdowiczii]
MPETPDTASREAARFDALVAEADSVSVDGWDFSWLDGRATEQRPSWGYARAMGERMGR